MASGEGLRPSRAALAGAGLGLLAAFGYPLAVAGALERFGVRTIAAAVLAVGLVSAALSAARRVPGVPGWAAALPLAFPVLALASGDAGPLRLVPAAIAALLAALFAGSLRGGGSLLEQAALLLEPHAPDFIGPYCRKATAAFAALFGAQALALAWLALVASGEGWALRANALTWGPTLIALATEFVVRKAWFRAYGETPWDRVLRALLPPERTERGRRSLAWIRRKREELGLPPPDAGRSR